MKRKITAILVLVIALAAFQNTAVAISLEQERDYICMLAAYTLVANNWQPKEGKPYRGHNIGCVMLDNKKNEVVGIGLNRNGELDDVTQHAEIQCIEDYISKHNEFYSPDLSNMTIYTTLESCAQCAGMTVTQGIRNVVHGQTDPKRGNVIERLNLDTRDMSDGFPPYNIKVTSSESEDTVTKALNKAYSMSSNYAVFLFLQRPETKAIFQKACKAFRNYKVTYPQKNARLYQTAKKFVLLPDDEKLKEEVTPLPTVEKKPPKGWGKPPQE